MPIDEIAVAAALRPLAARITPPGSKSITNRAMLLAAIADGPSQISGALLSDDTKYMAAALAALGFAVEIDPPQNRIAVTGQGGVIPLSSADLQVGNAGTAMRFVAGLLTLARGRFRLDGSARMRERPVGPLLEALQKLGVSAESENRNGCPPVIISSTGARSGGAIALDASLSSQFASALLMPAPLWSDGLRLTISGETARPFIDMTLRMMAAWGAQSFVRHREIQVPGRQRYRACDYQVEPDATAASYFAAAAAVIGGSVTIGGLRRESMQGDIGFFALLQQMGARINWLADGGVEVIGDAQLRGLDVTMTSMPDLVPTIAALAPFATSPTRIRGVAFIRHHESDRIHAIAAELQRLGVAAEEYSDGLAISPSPPRPATIETYDDHRIAMAFAVAGLRIPGLRIRNPDCVAKTYPDFFQDLRRLCQ